MPLRITSYKSIQVRKYRLHIVAFCNHTNTVMINHPTVAKHSRADILRERSIRIDFRYSRYRRL